MRVEALLNRLVNSLSDERQESDFAAVEPDSSSESTPVMSLQENSLVGLIIPKIYGLLLNSAEEVPSRGERSEPKTVVPHTSLSAGESCVLRDRQS